MSRALLASLSCLMLSTLSCSIFPMGQMGPDGLAPVDAAPPTAAEVAATPAPAPRSGPLIASLTEHLAARETGLHRGEVAQLARTIVAEAHRHQLDPALVLAVIAVESNYDSFALSDAGAMGLMQILPATGEELAAQQGILWRGPQLLFDPIVNVRLGVAYLRELSDRYGSLATALTAYNWGPGRIDRRLRLGTPLPKRYSQLVLEAYGEASRDRAS